MKRTQQTRPVAVALAGYERLLGLPESRKGAKLPSERSLAAEWGVSQAAVNRASLQLIAQGRLRRSGYALHPVSSPAGQLEGARVAVLTHRSLRFGSLSAEAARRGVEIVERYFVGRDTLRLQLRAAIAERFDGVVFRLSDGGWEWDEEAAEMDRLGIPFVVTETAPHSAAVVAEDWSDATGQLVSHLAAEGHREIALLGSLRRAHRSNVVRHAYEERCLRLRLGKSAARIVELAAHTDEAVAAACRALRERHTATTGLVVYDEDHVGAVMASLRAEGWGVPDRISVVCVGDGAHARNARPPVTALHFDTSQHGCLVLDQLCRMIRQMRAFGRASTRTRILLGGALVRRNSVLSFGSGAAPSDEEGLRNRTSRVWSSDREERRRQTEALLAKVHATTREGAAGDFRTLDLRGLANRSLTRQNGWLGQFPLLHLPVGRRVIHGVPFELVDERENGGKAAVVLRDRKVAGLESPEAATVTLAVNAQVRAVYLFHGCGFVGTPGPIAECEFKLRGDRVARLPLIARGLGAFPRGGRPPNIQDWWSDFPQIEGPGVLPYVVTEDGDPHSYERYLYSLEWRAPAAGVFLRSLRIRVLPGQPAVLGLLAVTVLLAPG